MTDLTPIVEAIITLAVALITAFLVPYIKSKLGAEKFADVQLWVNSAVAAAEMIYTGSGRGAEKKQYVVDFLAKKGYKLDYESIELLIEAAVLEIQNKGSE